MKKSLKGLQKLDARAEDEDWSEAKRTLKLREV